MLEVYQMTGVSSLEKGWVRIVGQAITRGVGGSRKVASGYVHQVEVSLTTVRQTLLSFVVRAVVGGGSGGSLLLLIRR